MESSNAWLYEWSLSLARAAASLKCDSKLCELRAGWGFVAMRAIRWAKLVMIFKSRTAAREYAPKPLDIHKLSDRQAVGTQSREHLNA